MVFYMMVSHQDVFYRVVSHQNGVLYDGLSSGWCFIGWSLISMFYRVVSHQDGVL